MTRISREPVDALRRTASVIGITEEDGEWKLMSFSGGRWRLWWRNEGMIRFKLDHKWVSDLMNHRVSWCSQIMATYGGSTLSRDSARALRNIKQKIGRLLKYLLLTNACNPIIIAFVPDSVAATNHGDVMACGHR